MRNSQDYLDYRKLLIARACLQSVEIQKIREKSLSNLDRWNANGTWCSAHDEWRELMIHGSDAEIIAVMTGLDQNSNRLRQSPPYVGLIGQDVVQQIFTKVRALRESGGDTEIPSHRSSLD